MTEQSSQAGAISLLTTDHRTVDGLSSQYEQVSAGDTDRKRQLVDQVIGEPSVLAAVEEQLRRSPLSKVCPAPQRCKRPRAATDCAMPSVSLLSVRSASANGSRPGLSSVSSYARVPPAWWPRSWA